jgi:hypothetical protein
LTTVRYRIVEEALSGNYYIDENGAAEERAASEVRQISRMSRRIKKHSIPSGKILLLAECEIGASPKDYVFGGPRWLARAKYYDLCLTDKELILVEVPLFLPDWSMLRPDVISAPLASVLIYGRRDELGWITFAAHLGDQETMRLNFEPGWRREAESLIRLLAQLRNNLDSERG